MFTLGTPLTGPKTDPNATSSTVTRTKSVGLGYNKKTFTLGPAGTSARGRAGRKKSLGLRALAGTIGLDPKEVMGGDVSRHKAAGADVRNLKIAQAKQLMKQNQPEPKPDEGGPMKEFDKGRVFNIGRDNTGPIGIGGPPIVKAPFSRKNPNPRAIKPVGGPTRL